MKFNLMFECEDCKQKFPIAQEQEQKSLTHKKEFKINGRSIFLTYYDCPVCGRRHFVQIDDKVSLNKLNDNKQMFIELSIAKSKGKEISKKQLAKFKKARLDLSNYRIKLMKQHTGKSIYDGETDSNFVLRFSM